MLLISCRLICLFILFWKEGVGSDCLFLKNVNQLNLGYLQSDPHLFCQMFGISFHAYSDTHPHTQCEKMDSAICLFKTSLTQLGICYCVCIIRGNCLQKSGCSKIDPKPASSELSSLHLLGKLCPARRVGGWFQQNMCIEVFKVAEVASSHKTVWRPKPTHIHTSYPHLSCLATCCCDTVGWWRTWNVKCKPCFVRTGSLTYLSDWWC